MTGRESAIASLSYLAGKLSVTTDAPVKKEYAIHLANIARYIDNEGKRAHSKVDPLTDWIEEIFANDR